MQLNDRLEKSKINNEKEVEEKVKEKEFKGMQLNDRKEKSKMKNEKEVKEKVKEKEFKEKLITSRILDIKSTIFVAPFHRFVIALWSKIGKNTDKIAIQSLTVPRARE